MPLSEMYKSVLAELEGLLADESDWLANSANTAALLYAVLPQVNWVGFYFLRPFGSGEELVVGPFQGRPACCRIALGRGVCGTAAAGRETIVVPDVHDFPGHIACDCDSKSEIVLPMLDEERLIGVLDIDSPVPDRFHAEDQSGLEALVAKFLAQTRFPDVI